MTLGRRGFLAGAGVAALAPGLVLADAPRKLTFITPQRLLLSFSEVMMAQGNGRFREQGIDVEVVGGHSAPQAIQQVLADQAQICRSGAITLVNAVAKGVPARSFGTIAQGSPFYVVSSNANPVETPRDFVGATIGVVSQGGPTDAALDAILIAGHIDRAQVHRQYLADTPGTFALIETGRIKAFIGTIDSLMRAEAAGAKVHAFNTGRYDPLPGQVYIATDEVIAQREADLVAFVRGVRAAIDDIVADKDLKRVFAVLRTFNVEGLDDEATAAKELRAQVGLWFSAGKENLLRNVPERWTQGVAIAAKAGYGKFVPNERLFTNRIVDKALGPAG